MNSTKLLTIARIPAAMCVLAVICFVCFTPLIGDDMAYGIYYPQRASFLHTIGGVWHHCNARFGDLTNYLWLYLLPRPVTALICGAMVALMIVMLRYLSGVKTALGLAVLLSCLFLICPWDDGMMLVVVHLNYVWAVALAALTLYLVTCKEMRSPRWLLYTPVACISGFGHEIVGIPMLLGVVAWLLFRDKSRALSPVRKVIIACLCIGCLISVSSPGSYHRMGNTVGEEVSLYTDISRVATTSYMGLIILLDAILLLLRRARFRELCRSIWLPMAVMAVASMAFVIVGHTSGRAGWVTQYFGLAALAYQCKDVSVRISKWVRSGAVCLLSFIFSVQWGAVIYWQRLICNEENACLEQYFANPDAQITVVLHSPADMPGYLMGKAGYNSLLSLWSQETLHMTYGHYMKLPPGTVMEP